MADEQKKPDAQQGEQAQSGAFADRKRNLMTLGLVGGLMIMEGVGIIVAVRVVGSSPKDTQAADELGGMYVDDDGQLLPDKSEIHISDVVALNSRAGRATVYQISVYALVDTKSREKIEAFFENHQNSVDDRLCRVVRASDPKYFEEPGLETLRRQFKMQLGQLLQDETIVEEILFPEFSRSRAD